MAGQSEEYRDRLGQAATPEGQEGGLKWDFYDLDFSVQRSRRYHEKMCAFYGVWRDWIKIVSVIAGSGVFLLLLASATHFAEVVAAFVALWSILDYVIKPAEKAEKHCDLGAEFTELAIRLARADQTIETYRELSAVRLEIEKSEPPCKRLVDLQARNDECRAREFPPEDIIPLSLLQRTFGYFATFGMRKVEEWKAARQRQVRAGAAS